MNYRKSSERNGRVAEAAPAGRFTHERKGRILVADEVWVATALLHREHPERADFTAKEIEQRAQRENIHGVLRPGVYVHAIVHCVANREPSPGRYRMLFATGKNTRRLFRTGDPSHPARRGAKITPTKADLPTAYRPLVDWYEQVYDASKSERKAQDPILALRGVGKEVWGNEKPDAYVQRLRKGWG